MMSQMMKEKGEGRGNDLIDDSTGGKERKIGEVREIVQSRNHDDATIQGCEETTVGH